MATITLELTPELEQQLRDEAAKQGLDPSHYIVNTLKEHLRSPLRDASRLSKAVPLKLTSRNSSPFQRT